MTSTRQRRKKKRLTLFPSTLPSTPRIQAAITAPPCRGISLRDPLFSPLQCHPQPVEKTRRQSVLRQLQIQRKKSNEKKEREPSPCQDASNATVSSSTSFSSSRLSSAREWGPSPPSAVSCPPSALSLANLQRTASCQRIVVRVREAVLDEVMVANAEGGGDGWRRCRCWRLILTSSD